ncbi:addiction module protein [cf. Phormidesmis sp. LEGE 11477]|uniref:addiction module protein n=1 Tax=cf. Phormidesmis sp. LEGE 11477 TaxID=1828680 RepID=UPI00187DE010|nr:addiction module protein [cf. Phormidesmis sp. LEGE 11477]MBE9064285.1 addiction module protein [cf. Phormidesmis sp. LEGE 11477]
MQPLLTVDIEQISISERIQLAEDLWDSILSNPESLVVTESQKQVLDERLEKHQTPPEDSSSWRAVKARLGNP